MLVQAVRDAVKLVPEQEPVAVQVSVALAWPTGARRVVAAR